jgi:hypothetical protein
LDATYAQAVGTQVALNSLRDLRKKMAENFHDKAFLVEANDRKLIPD